MRPMYETAESLAKELKVANYAGEKWKCAMVKTPLRYCVDFMAIREGLVAAFVEIRCRNYSWEKINSWGGYMFSLGKYIESKAMSQATGIPFILIVETTTGLYHQIFKTFDEKPAVQLGGRTDRSDWQDMEPVVILPCSGFTQL